MTEHLEIEGNIVGNGEEDQGMDKGCYEEDGGGPGLREPLSYRNEISMVHELPTWNNRGGRTGDRVVYVS